jgi:hypothetical protein
MLNYTDLGKFIRLVKKAVAETNKAMLEAEQEAQRVLVGYAHEVRGMYYDVHDQVQQVVYYYKESMAKDITPTKVVRVRPTVGGKDTPILLPAAYEQQTR